MPRLRRSSANPAWRRLHHAWQRLVGHERYKSNAVHFVHFGSERYKQVDFPSVLEARRVEGILRATQGTQLFPTFVHRLESTLWVRFVAGNTVDADNPAHLDGVHEFFAGLYRHDPVRVALTDTDLHQRLLIHIETLAEVQWIDADRARRLATLAERLKPESVWLGLEYVDALKKNLVFGAAGVVGIDVEAAWDGQLLGIGLAKARMRWLNAPATPILERLAALGAPDLAEQYAYAHLTFLAQYGVQNLFRSKPGQVPMSAVDAVLAGEAG